MNRGAEKRAASCDGKRIYTDILHARKVARAIHEHHNDRISPYRCKRCNFRSKVFFWHCPACGEWESFTPNRTETQ